MADEKKPGDYLADVQGLKKKMNTLVSGNSLKGIATGAVIGTVVGAGYSLLNHKGLFRGAIFGAAIGSGLTFLFMQVKSKK